MYACHRWTGTHWGDEFVDGSPASGPSLFAWTPGSGHTVSISSPYGSPNTRSVLVNWSDNGAATHSVIASLTSRTLTATVRLQYHPYLAVSPTCAATLKYAPASADGFYNSGTALQVTGVPAPGWFFAGWTEDMAGLTNPAKLTLSGEKRGTALYNTIAAPLQVTGFSPAGLPVGSTVRTLTMVGTGFTKATELFVNTIYRPPTYVSSTRLTFALTAADLTKANVLNVVAANVGPDPQCQTYDGQSFLCQEHSSYARRSLNVHASHSLKVWLSTEI
jgi:hypothetical protein